MNEYVIQSFINSLRIKKDAEFQLEKTKKDLEAANKKIDEMKEEIGSQLSSILVKKTFEETIIIDGGGLIHVTRSKVIGAEEYRTDISISNGIVVKLPK